ncbi:MAG TPA: ABC transporter substrate-binding protein, partial [Firmicutes bacterium]|nr:ABC transporter substrate-binding protein [Bacillota bacterium]
MKRFVGRALWPVVLLLGLALLLGGCGGKTEPQATPESKPVPDTIVVALAREGESLDHIKTSWTTDAHYTVMDRLVERDFNLKYVPHLAESWTSSPDGKVWTFKLRKDVKFHDGTPFNAAAVKWFFEALIDPANASPSASDYAFIDKIETPDEYTVEFRLKDPYPNILFKLSTTYAGIISPEAYKKYGPGGTKEYGTKQMVGTGLYVFKEWVPGDHLLVTANPDYRWGPEFVKNKDAAHIKNIRYRIIPDAATRLMEFEAGNVDLLLEVAPQDVERVKSIPNVE